MSTELREQIRYSLNMKDLDELLEIWKTNDRVEWSDITFEVLREILEQRLGEVPPQNEPILEVRDRTPETEADDPDDWKANLLDREDQPELYTTQDVIKLIELINKVAVAAVVIYLLFGLLNLSFVRVLFQGAMFTSADIVRTLPDLFFTFLSTALAIAIIYFPLKALALILRILMEMEFNSRKPG